MDEYSIHSGSSSVWNFLGVGNSSEAERKVDPSTLANYSNACKLGNLKLLKELLVDKSVNPAEHNNSPIRIASEYGHEKIVALLLTDKRVDPTALDNQVRCCHRFCFLLLLLFFFFFAFSKVLHFIPDSHC
jgi:hypothetical protein